MTLKARQSLAKVLQVGFLLITIFAVIILAVLIGDIINRSFGTSAIEYVERFEDWSSDGSTLETASDDMIREVIQNGMGGRAYDTLEEAKPFTERSHDELLEIVIREVLQPKVVKSWHLIPSLTNQASIIAERDRDFPDAVLTFRSWVQPDFLMKAQSMDPLNAGIRGAIIGTLMTIIITMLVAFPLGVGAAIWLEEYAPDNKVSRFIQTNIYNLAGVPSIIYGMLGLAIFVRTLGDITQGRTILSAALTLALLILPIIIINTQEALKAIPQSLRHASLALGATRWQTIWHHVLPASMDRILTGSVLAMSRAIGETAPLVVVGASAFLTHDPSSVFDRFTTLPIQIYQWTSLPGDAYRNLAAGAILVLMVLLLSLNSFAIIMRNRYRKDSKQ